jgi:hypothetical protein
MHLFMTIRYSFLFFVFVTLCGCLPKEQWTTGTTNTVVRQENPNLLAFEIETIPKDYCIVKTNYESFDYDKDFTWMINGHEITVDSLKEFKVKTHGALDTLVFNNTSRRTKEIILCDLTKGERYEIFYNSCCSDFYLWKESKQGREKRSVEFKMNGKPKGKKLIGGVSFEAAFLKVGSTVTLTGDYMRSPMFPNRYKIFVQEFEPWSEDSTIARIINPRTKKDLGAFKDSNKS